MPSFTARIPDLENVGPIVEIKLAMGQINEDSLRAAGARIPTPAQTLAMIDTGASSTVVDDNLIKGLNLNPISATLVSTASESDILCYEYALRFIFPNDVIVETTVIAISLDSQHVQCLIGRDVLSRAVFIYTGHNNSFTLSF